MNNLANPKPVEFLPDVETWVITSPVPGYSRQIWVALPDSYSKDHAPYPVLIATDANSKFGTIVETARIFAASKLIPEIIVVGLGYPMPGQAMKALHAGRTFDLSPSVCVPAMTVANTSVAPVGSGVAPATQTGGAPAYLDFIRDDLLAEIEGSFNVSTDDRALYGHSLGGLFASYALLNSRGLFQRYIISSPSLWWDDCKLFELEAAYAQTSNSLEARAFFSVGANEEEPACKMVSNLIAFEILLSERNYDGLDFESYIFDDENHVSVIPAAISRGLRSIYALQ